MQLSSEMRKLKNKWDSRAIGGSWPKYLEWLQISGLRGWNDQRIEFPFPIIAIVGENGSGKSTVIQSAASVYKTPDKNNYASDFFPDTTWDSLHNVNISFLFREGQNTQIKSIRKPTDRWRGNPERPERNVQYIDLSRIQPVSARTGYRRLANPTLTETGTFLFEKEMLDDLSNIMGRKYASGKMATTNMDPTRQVPIIERSTGTPYSGFHQGAGETTIAEFLQIKPTRYSLILIDEIETSLHPRAQRRLMRILAERCRLNDLQVILTTHSPYILEELPLEGRIYILEEKEKIIMRGVSPQFAMTKMDDELYPECDVYVEDNRAATLLKEILCKYSTDSVQRCRLIPYGAASVGASLGQMVEKGNFPRPSCVYLDGDQTIVSGCNLLPGADAPERVVFSGLGQKNWEGVAERIGRPFTQIVDACKKSMVYDHKEWVFNSANQLVVGGESLWEALCYCWVQHVLTADEAKQTVKPIEDLLSGLTRHYSSATAQGLLYK